MKITERLSGILDTAHTTRREKSMMMIRRQVVCGVPAALAAMTVLLSSGCGGDPAPGDAAPGPGSDTTTPTQTPDSTESTQPTGPTDPTMTPKPGEVPEFVQDGPEYVFATEGRYAVRLNPSLVYEVDVPDMWEVYQGRFLSTSVYSGGNGIFAVAELPARRPGCHNTPAATAPGTLLAPQSVIS